VIAIESFIIINFIYALFTAWATHHGHLNWDNENTVQGKQHKGHLFGVLQAIFAIVLFGLLAALIEDLTSANGDATKVGLNAAGPWMVMFGLLFAVFEVFAGFTILEHGSKKMPGLSPASVMVTNKVAWAIGALAFGFACRHINLGERKDMPSGDHTPLVHAIESFIIINFFLTAGVELLALWGRIEW